jgi:hypothetical protein
MNRIIYERIVHETDIARVWWQLPPGTLLPLTDGRCCRLLSVGQPGGAAGPDVRDAVLQFLPAPMYEGAEHGETVLTAAEILPPQLTGDVEFHVRASDWFAHQHHQDTRYNRVCLHVVYYMDQSGLARRQDRVEVPTTTLLDLPRRPILMHRWPCSDVPPGSTSTLTLLYAGLQRFYAKSQHFGQELDNNRLAKPSSLGACDLYDTCFVPALAEGLGYGGNRTFFLAVGLRLSGRATRLPMQPDQYARYPTPLDAQRLRILLTLHARWQARGAWQTLLAILQEATDNRAARQALREAFQPLSTARTDIVVCNIVLPFAVAVAERQQDRKLATQAQQLYLSYPALPSNRITRLMSKQLQLAEPRQACLQQGLQHIYAQTCREKRCATCLYGGKRI